MRWISTTFFALKPTYYTNGNVSGVTNAAPSMSGRTQSFTYNNLNLKTGGKLGTPRVYLFSTGSIVGKTSFGRP